MTHVFTVAERSRVMRAVRSRDTSPELTVRRIVSSLGYRYRLHGRHVPGAPHLVFAGPAKSFLFTAALAPPCLPARCG